MKWRIAQLIFEQAVLEKNGKGLNFENSAQHDERKFFVWGEEREQYGCMRVGYNNANGDQIKFLEYFATSFRERIFDFGYFWQHKSRVDLILEIAKGKGSGYSENEMLEIAEFIKEGWVRRNGESLNLCVPVYTDEQLKRIKTLLVPVIEMVAELTREILERSTDVLIQHTPASKKKEAKEIAWLKIHDIAICGSVELMQGNGVLRRVSFNEHPATYVALK